MKVIIATCFESNEERAKFVFDLCKQRNYEVTVLTTDFSHIKKMQRNDYPDGFLPIKTKPYKRNLSFGRIQSHKQFAKDLFLRIKKVKPDLIWLMIPANSLLKEAKEYKKINPEVKIIVDVIDMWPESLPLNINKNNFPFSIWRSIRLNNIDCSDSLVSECDLYKEELSKEYDKEIHTLRWAKDSIAINRKELLPNDSISLCYIGSINNIIDIDKIVKIVASINKPVTFHLIGEGENTDYFVSELKKVCEVKYYGAIRDKDKKDEVFSKCHAGINIYKDNLYIGLTVKCLDYFEHGLPIINNIKGDTWNFVEEEKVGINIESSLIVDADDLINMRNNNQNIINLFNNNFTKAVFDKECSEIIDEVVK